MSYPPDLARAAYRHLEAADHLLEQGRLDVAGYLFGIAAECAVKAMLRDVGIHPLPPKQRREDPYYAHFPELKTQLRDKLTGRRSTALSRFIMDDRFFAHWSTMMRYAHGQEVRPEWVELWRDQAHQIVASIGT